MGVNTPVRAAQMTKKGDDPGAHHIHGQDFHDQIALDHHSPKAQQDRKDNCSVCHGYLAV
jgi:hypothetical protein